MSTEQEVRVFLRLYSAGVKHGNKTVIEVPMKTNTYLGTTDSPLSTLGWAILLEIVEMTRYSNKEAGVADVDKLIKFLQDLKSKDMNISSAK